MGSRWRGLLAPINKPTGDGRRIAPGGFTNRPLPLPLKWQRADNSGHDESVTVGVIDVLNIDEEAGEVWGEVELFDDVNPAITPQLAEDAKHVRTLMEKRVVGPSVDPGSAQATAVMTGMDRAPTMAEIQRFCDQNNGNMPPTEMLFTSYEIAGATLVPIPAFSEARPLEPMAAGAGLTASKVRVSGWSDLPIAPRDRPWDADAAKARLAASCGLDGDSPDWDCYASGFLYEYTDRDPQTRAAYVFPVVDVIDGQRHLVPRAVFAAANVLEGGYGGSDIPAEKQKAMRGVVAGLYKRLAKEFDDDSVRAPWSGKMSAILAAAKLPPLDGALFLDPELPQITPLTREPMGNGWTRIFGHVATHDVCLVGGRGTCTTAPFSDQEYKLFHRYHRTAGGIELPLAVGRLTAAHGQLSATCRCCPGNDDHACNNVGFGAAVAHHDRMRVLAYGRVGEDEKNNAIWFAGVEAPEVDERDIKLLSRRKISGDWRDVAGNMELTEILVLARREPGFPLPRVSIENGRQRSLTAASPVGAIIEREGGGVDMIDAQQLSGALGSAIAGVLDEFGFNPSQRRGPDGKWIKMGGPGAAGGSRSRRGRSDGDSGNGSNSGGSDGGGGAGAGGSDRTVEERAVDGLRKLLGDRFVEVSPPARRPTPRTLEDSPFQPGDPIIFQGPGGPQIHGTVVRLHELVGGSGPGGVSMTWRERDGSEHTHDVTDPRFSEGRTAQKAAADEAADRGAELVREWIGGDIPGRPDTSDRAANDAYNRQILEDLLGIADQNDDGGYGEDDEYGEDEESAGLLEEVNQLIERLSRAGVSLTAAAQTHTGAMVALRMSEADAARLAVTDGEPLDQLHLTLAYLGDAADIPPEVREKIEAKARELASAYAEPIQGDGFAIDVFNPGTANDRDTAIVMGVGGQPMADVYDTVMAGLGGIEGLSMPEQHVPHIPHVTLQYTDDLGRVKALADRVGPVTFDRLRLAFGGETIDIPIGVATTEDDDDSDGVDQQDAAFASDATDGEMCAKKDCDKSSAECASCADCTPAVFSQRARAAALALRATLASTQLGCCKTLAK